MQKAQLYQDFCLCSRGAKDSGVLPPRAMGNVSGHHLFARTEDINWHGLIEAKWRSERMRELDKHGGERKCHSRLLRRFSFLEGAKRATFGTLRHQLETVVDGCVPDRGKY